MPLVLQILTELHIYLLIGHSHANGPKNRSKKEDLLKKQANKQTKKQMRVFRYWMVSLKGKIIKGSE